MLSISRIFNHQYFSFIVDSDEIYDVLSSFIDNVIFWDFHDTEFFPENSVVVCVRWDSWLSLRKMRQSNKKCKILLLPQVAFDISSEVIRYSLELLMLSDFDYAILKHKEWSRVFREIQTPMNFYGENSNISCRLNNSLKLSTIDNVVLESGDFRSVAEYFEINLENSPFDANSFSVEGYMMVEGALIARSVDFQLTDYDRDFEKNMVRLIAASKHTQIRVKENKLVSVLVDDTEYLPSFKCLLGQTITGVFPNITEFAIGFNYKIRKNLNWRYNSQVNEGVEGIHIGIGDGKNGFHVDFITTQILYTNNIV